jgi:hypothetical protein
MKRHIVIPPAATPIFPNHCAVCLREPSGSHEVSLELTVPVTVDRAGIPVVAGHRTTRHVYAVPYCGRHLAQSGKLMKLIAASRRTALFGGVLLSAAAAGGTAQLLFMYTYYMEKQPLVFGAIVAGAFAATLPMALPLLFRLVPRLFGLLLSPKRPRGPSECAALGMRFTAVPTPDGDSQLTITVANPGYAELFQRVNASRLAHGPHTDPTGAVKA